MIRLDLDGYLGRIGFTGALRPDLATLGRLQSAHVAAIPFEGMDPFLGRPVSLDLDAIQAKLVASRRGGYCFEHNALFQAVLDAAGFATTGLGGRVRWMSPREAPLGPREHMLLRVDLPGGPAIVDVGFGACLLDAPLALETGTEQRTAMGTFRLDEADGLYWLSARQPSGWRTMYAFDLQPQRAADYELGNWYTSTHPNAPFPHVLIMERLLPDERLKLVNTRFVREGRDGEVLSEEVIDDVEAFGKLLDDVFGVAPPVPVAELFARCGAGPERR
jgi:N-hydroxyarylamine O-acetyltransferase